MTAPPAAVGNPALLKLDLYCQGMRLDESCFIEKDGGRGRSCAPAPAWAAGSSSSSPGAVDQRPGHGGASRTRSPYTLHSDGRALPAATRGRRWRRSTLSPRPAWYDGRRPARGKPMTPHRHAAGHVSRHLSGEGLRLLDREAPEVQLQVLLGGAQPRRRRRRREVGGRGAGGRPRRAPRVRHHVRRLQHRPLRGRHLSRHPRALHQAHQGARRACWSACRRRRIAT